MKMEWENKKVLVTGADGFVGSHLTERLVGLGTEVYAYVKSSSSSGHSQYKLKNIEHLRNGIKEIMAGDISSGDSVNIIKKIKPDVIFHLAASAYVPFSFDHPKEVIKINLMGTLNVMEAGMSSDIERIVCTSSSEIYGTACTEKINEEHPLNPSSPYGASKVAADRCAYAYWNTYGLPIAIIRPFNMFGPRHTYDVIPKFIKLALRNEPLTVYGSGNQSRDFLYVDDAVDAFLAMGSHKNAIGQAINFGTGKDYTINDTADKIINISKSDSKVIHVEERKSEVEKLICDFSKAKGLIGWEPKISFDDGLRKNIDWERNILLGEK